MTQKALTALVSIARAIDVGTEILIRRAEAAVTEAQERADRHKLTA